MPSAASLVPNFDVTVYIVFDDFGEAGWIYREAEEASLESVIADLLTGQFKNPARVVAFNTSEGWSRDVSETVAREVFRRVAELGLSLAINSREFVETYVEQNELLHAGKSPHKLAKGYDLDKVAAVHEAGHAVARYLCADAMGFSFVEAVGYIEIAPPFSRPNLDAKSILAPKAASCGPVYSRPMMDFLNAESMSLNLTAAVEACKDHGIDVEMWVAVKALICMAGPVAEALFTNRLLSEIANECSNDLDEATRYCVAAGMTTQEASKQCKDALNWAREVFDDPRNWDAVLALADSLPTGGRINGKQIERIITRAMHGTASSRETRQSEPIGHE